MTSDSARPSGGKKLSEQAVIGARGVNLIERIVLLMGCGWHPTNQSLETGIDGEIELVDPNTRVASNAVVRVQSRATVRPFTAETETSFEYLCVERDLAYWLSGNTPVILVVSRPHTDEAYWVDLKAYFATAVRRKERKVRFEKASMRFSQHSLGDLQRIGLPKSQGLYSAPLPIRETLYSNLLVVTKLPNRLWLGETDLRAPELLGALRERNAPASEFVLKNKRILSAHDLTSETWKTLVDRGTVEEFPASEWSDSDDKDKRRVFVELLNHCLYARAREIGVARRRADNALYFSATADGVSRKVAFRSVKDASERTVFQAYPYTKGERAGEIAYYRHASCITQFRRYDGQWYLEITPTYHFTSDGQRQHPLAEKFLSGIKRQEKQGAVLYQLVMWASLLRGAEEIDAGYFSSSTYPFLQFGPLETFSLDVGIDDKAWLPNEDREIQAVGLNTLSELPLFEELDPYAPESTAVDSA
jgi:hypothetical protein